MVTRYQKRISGPLMDRIDIHMQVGRGNWPHPGEISLAHRGVLFLDELLAFSSKVLEVLRQPLDDKVVTISRPPGVSDLSG